MTSTAILIPARYNSSRFPGKLLKKNSLGQTVVGSVIQTCKQSGLPVFLLTDHDEIAQEGHINRVAVIREDADRPQPTNGTERCSYFVRDSVYSKPYDYFINVQADMPDVTVDMIKKIEDSFRYSFSGNDVHVSTLFTDMKEELKEDPNTVKLILIESRDAHYRCLWFGRGMTGYGHHHLGIYGYSKKALTIYTPDLRTPIEEELEGLEQLRWLKNGYSIMADRVEFDGIEINTENDWMVWRDRDRKKFYGGSLPE